MAIMTLIGLNSYTSDHLFDNMVMPVGIDKDTLVNNILLRGGQFEVIYPDPVFLSDAIGVWSKKWQRTIEKWVKADALEYNPIENYDRMEEFTDTGSVTAHDTSKASGTGNTVDKVSAYDSSALQPSGSSDSSSGSVSNADSSSSSTSHHTARLHGNIGVTTSQQMLEAEYTIASWNIYEHITDMFLTEFVIPIYD